MKFNIGDIIIGNERNEYGITNKTTRCEVVETICDETIRVEVLEGSHIGCRYAVAAYFFDLVEQNQQKSFSADEWMKFMMEA